ncbi:hypothetical protein DFJ58DRAFT_728870 [Suillus subalutaceus]|uniref:uncharacterized protein n=1 Tax=Suillus subalutaceus TaxID=48586 RepID=UPI001B877450|nr:uncharacterized protein DFJ58DRAFT_728870 [Suillus subalutaceus]KAG1851430.1 hypothetical protein DFJ58DRAFT_728870 [Suillus subalutaceus]
MDMAKLMHEVFSTHAERVTILSPLVLSAGAELMNHMDEDRTALAILSSPPLLVTESSCHRRRPLPRAGPSQPKGVPRANDAEDRPAQSKRQRQKSKVIITGDDDLELDEVVPTVPVRKERAVNMIYKPGQLTKVVTEQKTRCSLWHSVVASDDDMDADAATNTGPALKMGVPYVELPGPQLKEDDFADTMAPSWAPHCGQCVARDLICCQAFNKDHGGKLKVCAFCSRLKIRCGGKGSEVPTVKGKSATSRRTRSQSRRQRLPPAQNIATQHVEPSVPYTTTTTQNEDEVPTRPSTSIPPPTSASTDRDSLLALQAEVATLHTAVAALEDQVVAGDKQCKDANTRLAEQEARSALLTERFNELLRKLLPAATSATTECGAEATGELAAGELAAGELLASDSTTEVSSTSADPAGKATGQSAAVPLTHTAESSHESAAGPANLGQVTEGARQQHTKRLGLMQNDLDAQHQPRTNFRIWQQNLQTSSHAWEHLLKNLNPNTFDLACIQEPFLNPVNLANASNLKCYWDVLYPTTHHTNQDRTQVIILINKKISKNQWHMIPIQSANVMALELTGEFGKVLPQGIATLEASATKNLTHPDNVFCSAQLQHTFTTCTVEYHLRPVVTDHFPIISSIDLNPDRINDIPRHNYREADWDVINKALSEQLRSIPPPIELTSGAQFEEALSNLTDVIAKVVDSKVPKSKPSPYAK